MARKRWLALRRWLACGAISAALGVLLVPTGTALAYETHTVQAGDTLESLAQEHHVSLENLAAANGLDPWSLVYEGQELVVPREEGTEAVVLEGVVAYQQSRSLSCEFASIYIATSVFGAPISEEESIERTTWSDNPHFGFRGNIDGPWGVTDDYGIYAEALVPILDMHGFAAKVAYVPEASYLQAQLDAGHPTIVWIATRGDTGHSASTA